MSFAEKKLEIFIAGFLLVLMWGVSSLMKNWSSPRGLSGVDIVYEMPRPKSFKGTEFDLSDREIDRRFVNPFEKKKAEEAKAQAKGTAEKNAIAAKAAQEAAKKVEAARKAEVARRAKVTARVVERDRQAALVADAERRAQAQQAPAPAYANSNVQTQPAEAPNADNKDDNKRSPDQWRALISAQPTTANIDAMYKAVMAGELDQGTYFEIVTDLLKNTKSETQAAGLYAAGKAGNSTAFAVVVQNDSHLNADVEPKVKTFFDSYAQVGRFQALANVLQSKDLAVIMKGLEIVKLAKQTKGGGTPTDNGQVTTFQTAFDKTLKPALEALAKNSSNSQVTAAIADILGSQVASL